MTRMRKKPLRLIFIFILFPSMLFSQKLEIKELVNYWDGNLNIIGLIKNDTDIIASFVSLSIICRDADEQIIYTDSTYAFSPITINREIPFKFLISKEDAVGIKRYTVSVDDYQKGGSGTYNFEISKFYITEKNSDYYKYSGEITNLNQEAKKYVEIAFLGFDENGKLIFFETTYASKSILNSKDLSLFEFYVPTKRNELLKTYKCFAYSD